MARKSIIRKNWPKYLLQWGILAALILFITGLIPSKEAVDVEAYCPMGGIQALSTYAVRGSLPCSMSTTQIIIGIALAAAVVLFSKLFCAFICPIGTVQDLLMKLRKRLRIKNINIKSQSVADKILRIFKYILLFWIFYMTMTSSELFCKNLDPYYAVATGLKGEITLWMSIITILLVVLGGFFINSFWCRYICPLGAISNSLKFWIWIVALFGLYYLAGVLGLHIPWVYLLGAFCLAGYLLEILHGKPQLQLLTLYKDQETCTDCGLCTKNCPYSINVASCKDTRVTAVDCTLCGDCIAVCAPGSLRMGVCKKPKSKFWKYAPAVLTVVIVALALWAGSQKETEIPTINETWGIEIVEEDGTVTTLIEDSQLSKIMIEGLRSVKCYGSSMTFKARLEKIPGIHGVKCYVGSNRAELLYRPSVISPEQIQEAIYTPSKFRVSAPDHNIIDSLKVVVIRTDKMFDKLDINYLGMQMRETDKKIYGLESEFACPLIIRVYMDPSEEISEDWFEEIVEMKTLNMPQHGGGFKEIPLNYEFIELEKGVSYVSTRDYIKNMFNPFNVEFERRLVEFEGKEQFVYEIADEAYDKPIILRNMPFLSNHLSSHDGIIGIYLELNDDLVPTIGIRYAAPMNAKKLWELMTMETWTITFSPEDVREVPAKLHFKKSGVERKL